MFKQILKKLTLRTGLNFNVTFIFDKFSILFTLVNFKKKDNFKRTEILNEY